MTEPDHADFVARNIRRFRDREALSLSALARRSGIAKATLSSIENGDGNPTIATLHSLANALRVPVAQLVGPREIDGPRLIRGAGGTPGTDDVPIESFVPGGIVELYDVRYEPGVSIRLDPHQSGVIERVLIHSGSIRVGPVDDPAVLAGGDYLAFPGDQPHIVETVGDDVVRGSLVVTYPVTAPTDSPIHSETR